jgi:hypothetical protein
MSPKSLRYLSCAAIAGLVGCATTTFNKVSYDRPASVESRYSADVTLVPGTVTAGKFTRLLYPIPIPIPWPAPKELLFDVDDQKILVSSLIDELNRLRVLKARDTSEPNRSTADV